MPEHVLLDNDVALKVACYSLVNEVIAITTVEGTPPAILNVGRYVIRDRLKRASNIADVSRAKAAFEKFLEEVILLEPNDEELAIAADLEAEAGRRDLELDGGESQLLAVLASRACSLLVTGDKRAIAAMALVALDLAANRIGCFEQLMAHVVHAVGIKVVRPLVCGEPRVDRAVTLCFACSRAVVSLDDVMSGLSSYISHLNQSAPGVLLPGGDLSSMTA
jgi:hypothetical protein